MSKEGGSEHKDDTEIVVACIRDLMQQDPGDDRFRIFDTIAFHTENLFGGHLKQELAEGRLSDETRRDLLANPAAPFLLAYMVNSLQIYNSINGEFAHNPKAPTAEKRKALAESFRLIGKTGEKYPTAMQRLSQELNFSSAYGRALVIEQAKVKPSIRSAEQRARTTALKEVYRQTFSEDFNPYDDTHKKRMMVLRKQLAHIEAA